MSLRHCFQSSHSRDVVYVLRTIYNSAKIQLGMRNLEFFMCSFLSNTHYPVNTNTCITFVQCWTNVEDVWPMLYKCYTNVSVGY